MVAIGMPTGCHVLFVPAMCTMFCCVDFEINKSIHDIISALLALCAGNNGVTGDFPSQKASNVAVLYFRVSFLPDQIVGWEEMDTMG